MAYQLYSYLTLNLDRSTKVIACHICIPNASFFNEPPFNRVGEGELKSLFEQMLGDKNPIAT